MYTRARPRPGGGNTHHPLRSTIARISVRVGDGCAPILCRLLAAVRGRFFVLVPVEVEDARCVVLALRPQRRGELVMPVRFGLSALLLERPAERVMRIVIGGRQLEHLPELL